MPDTLVSSVRDIYARTRHFGKSGTTSIHVPDALASSVRPQQNTLVPGTGSLKYPGYGYGYPWYPGITVLFISEERVQPAERFMQGVIFSNNVRLFLLQRMMAGAVDDGLLA